MAFAHDETNSLTCLRESLTPQLSIYEEINQKLKNVLLEQQIGSFACTTCNDIIKHQGTSHFHFQNVLVIHFRCHKVLETALLSVVMFVN